MHSFEFPRANRSTIAARPSRLPMALFAILGLVLFWLILSRSLVAYLATTAPEAALFLRSGDPAALLDARTGSLAWMAVSPVEEIQIGHY